MIAHLRYLRYKVRPAHLGRLKACLQLLPFCFNPVRFRLPMLRLALPCLALQLNPMRFRLPMLHVGLHLTAFLVNPLGLLLPMQRFAFPPQSFRFYTVGFS